MKINEYIAASDWNCLSKDNRRALLDYLTFMGFDLSQAGLLEWMSEPSGAAIALLKNKQVVVYPEHACLHLRRITFEEILKSCKMFVTK